MRTRFHYNREKLKRLFAGTIEQMLEAEIVSANDKM